jgi:Family of unknown function (DUF5989)
MEPSDRPSANELLLKETRSPSFLGSLADFLWSSRKWWLLPLILLLLLLGVAMGLVNTAAAPFIYTLF